MDPAYPISTFFRALQSTVGWCGVVFGTVIAGYWLGMWIGLDRLPGLGAALSAVYWAAVAWVLFPRTLVGVAVTALSLYLPLKLERPWLYIGAAAVNLLTWMGIAASVFSEVRHWW